MKFWGVSPPPPQESVGNVENIMRIFTEQLHIQLVWKVSAYNNTLLYIFNKYMYI